MKDRPRFREDHKEFEPIHCMNVSSIVLKSVQPYLVEEFARQDSEKLMNGQSGPNKIVYDCIDPSPYYDSSQDPYMDDNDLIEMPSDDQNTDYRKYPYG